MSLFCVIAKVLNCDEARALGAVTAFEYYLLLALNTQPRTIPEIPMFIDECRHYTTVVSTQKAADQGHGMNYRPLREGASGTVPSGTTKDRIGQEFVIDLVSRL